MKKWQLIKQSRKRKRGWRVRKKVQGTSLRPRLSINKTNNHLSAQLIDDEAGRTLGSISTLSKEFRGTENGKKNKASARILGEKIAEIATNLNVKEVNFDRGSYKYHGVLAELADAARGAGLKF